MLKKIELAMMNKFNEFFYLEEDEKITTAEFRLIVAVVALIMAVAPTLITLPVGWWLQ